MSEITKNIDVQVKLTPQDLAKVWCSMDADEQAEFFDEIAFIAARWGTSKFDTQLAYIHESRSLTDKGRAVMDLIGEYGTGRNL